jgi:two-component system response regulator GlrR
MAGWRCGLVVLAPRLQAQAGLLADALRRADCSVLTDGPNAQCEIAVWLTVARGRAQLLTAIAQAHQREPSVLHWLAAPDEELTGLLPIPQVAEALALPVRDGDLRWRLERVLRQQPSAATPALPGIVGQSPKLLGALALLKRFAACDAGVLVLGETGTGKELFAQALHSQSARAAGPFVALNCAAIPADLIESELFGHAKGAYTSAIAARQGLVEAAEGGTLFLDDVDGLPAAAQAKLLRFLQEHEYRRVGCNTLRRAQVRVVAASNCNLMQRVTQGQFRADLYYRLNVLTLNLPPLRERLDDLSALAAHVLGPRTVLSAASLQRLRQHRWPGNVRELGHVLQRAQVLTDGPEIGPEHLLLEGDDMTVAAPTLPRVGAGSLRQAKQQFEREWLDQLLRSHHGNVTQAAAAAHKDRRAFIALMRKHAMDSAPYRASVPVSTSTVGV